MISRMNAFRIHLSTSRTTAGLSTVQYAAPRNLSVQWMYITCRALLQNLGTLQNYALQVEVNTLGTLTMFSGNGTGLETIGGVQTLTQVGTAAANFTGETVNQFFGPGLNFPVQKNIVLWLLLNNDANLSSITDVILGCVA